MKAYNLSILMVISILLFGCQSASQNEGDHDLKKQTTQAREFEQKGDYYSAFKIYAQSLRQYKQKEMIDHMQNCIDFGTTSPDSTIRWNRKRHGQALLEMAHSIEDTFINVGSKEAANNIKEIEKTIEIYDAFMDLIPEVDIKNEYLKLKKLYEVLVHSTGSVGIKTEESPKGKIENKSFFHYYQIAMKSKDHKQLGYMLRSFKGNQKKITKKEKGEFYYLYAKANYHIYGANKKTSTTWSHIRHAVKIDFEDERYLKFANEIIEKCFVDKEKYRKQLKSVIERQKEIRAIIKESQGRK